MPFFQAKLELSRNQIHRKKGHFRDEIYQRASSDCGTRWERCRCPRRAARAEASLFGNVASDSTVWRTFQEITPSTRDALKVAIAEVRAKVWNRSAATTGNDPVTLDVDASLVTIHTEEKQGTAPTYKGGYGFHPLLVFSDQTGECLSGMLRPGNATANAVSDHVAVLDEAIAQLPSEIAAGHQGGDAPALVVRDIVIRSDSAGCTEGFLAACRARAWVSPSS